MQCNIVGRLFIGGLLVFGGFVTLNGIAESAPRAVGTIDPIHSADEFAWDRFIEINAPAGNGSNDALWETWATDDDTFPQEPKLNSPPTWPGNTPRAKTLHRSRQLTVLQKLRKSAALPRGDEERIVLGGTQEVRRNLPAFNFVVNQDLWHKNGLIAAMAKGQTIEFPQGSIEIKADWKAIDASQKPKYHWNVDSQGGLFGLVALHISTKDLPNWFWATFEHVDNPQRGKVLGCHDAFGAIEAAACDTSLSPTLVRRIQDAGLGSEWQNYRLAGTQIDFIDPTGRPTRLGNSITEDGFVATASCITCHARSAFDTQGKFLSVFKSVSPIEGNVGAPDSAWFFNSDGTRSHLQVDFVWAFLAAQPLTDDQPEPAPTGPRSNKASNPIASKEARVLRRTMQFAKASPEQERTVAVAARTFAKAVSGNDDRRYLHVFQNALNVAVGGNSPAAPLRSAGAAQESDRSLEPIPDPRFSPRITLPPDDVLSVSTNSLLANPIYVKNARRFVDEISERIIGGMPTDGFLDCVAVGDGFSWCCTGTLVARNVVVTAGHCSGVCSSRIFIGKDINAPGKVYRVKNAVQHPDYHKNNIHNDLTVLILESDVDGVVPSIIAPSDATDQSTFVRAVGFGNSDVNSTTGFGIKRMVDIAIATVDCSGASGTQLGCDSALEFVAGAPFLNKDTCNGDSGGPVYVQHQGEWYVAGATSRATEGSSHPCGDGGIYVRLDRYRDWIRSVPGGHW